MSAPLSVTGPGLVRRRFKHRPGAMVWLSFVIVAAALVAAIFGPLLVPDATDQSLLTGMTTPGPGHPLGTDQLGRDVLQLLVAGARTAVLGALAVAVGSLVMGNLIGVPAGYFGGWRDGLAMRWADLMFSLPALLVAIVVTGVLGGGFILAVLVLVVLFSPGDTRLSRAAVLDQRHRPYVEAARLLDLSPSRIMARHVWPNVIPVVTSNAFLNFAFALVALASLSFLGLGVEPGSPDWGRTLADNRSQLLGNPWAALAPALAIIATAVAVTIVGDWVHERLEERGRAR